MTPEQRQQARRERSKPVLAQIETLLLQHLHTALPQSAFGKALHYLHGQWPKLIRYVDNGAWPISNNPCENAIRPFVIGRKYAEFGNMRSFASRTSIHWLSPAKPTASTPIAT
jgi:transposase